MNFDLTPQQFKKLQRLFDLGVNRASTMLNYLTELPVDSTMSPIELISPEQLKQKLRDRLAGDWAVAMELSYQGDFEGVAQLVFPPQTSAVLIDAIAVEERRQLDREAIRSRTLSEVGNIYFNGLMGSLNNVTERGITYMAPSYREGTADRLLSSDKTGPTSVAIYGTTDFQIEPLLVEGDIIIFFTIYKFETLMAKLEKITG